MPRAYLDLHWPVIFTFLCLLIFVLAAAFVESAPPIWPALIPILFVQPMIYVRQAGGPTVWFLVVNEGFLVILSYIWFSAYFRLGS